MRQIGEKVACWRWFWARRTLKSMWIRADPKGGETLIGCRGPILNSAAYLKDRDRGLHSRSDMQTPTVQSKMDPTSFKASHARHDTSHFHRQTYRPLLPPSLNFFSTKRYSRIVDSLPCHVHELPYKHEKNTALGSWILRRLLHNPLRYHNRRSSAHDSILREGY